MVPGTPNSIPSNQAIELLGLRVLHDRLPNIADSLEPGGSGDLYAGLTADQHTVLQETSRLGFPVRGWWQYATLSGGSFSDVAGGVRTLDPTYVNDFWQKPGYEGNDPSVRSARVQQAATVVSTVPAPLCRGGQVIGTICPSGGIVLSQVAAGPLLTGADLTVTSGTAKNKTLTIDTVTGSTVHFAGGSDPSIVRAIRPGDTVHIDNSWVIALQYYPRHQVPSRDMYGWNQYRSANGTPAYPQRSSLVGPTFAAATSGSVATGRFHGKMIMLASVDDVEAFAWSADWYSQRAKEAFGGKLTSSYRAWYMDNAGHTEPRSTYANTHIVDYTGELQQALLDLDAWVRSGTPPAPSTVYSVNANTEVVLPAKAGERKGLQPVVTLKVQGGETAHVKVGQTVTFTAQAYLPPDTGNIVAADWDFAGIGDFPYRTQASPRAPSETFTTTHKYSKTGTYFAVVRVTARRDGDSTSPYRQILNLARVRIVVG
jgi:hypothetical protein